MGDMADMALDMCAIHEAEWDDYVCGNMSDYDAYEAGIIDESGYAETTQLDRVVARNPIPTPEALHNELSHAVKDLTIATHSGAVRHGGRGNMRAALNAQAQANLRKPCPTCNVCGDQMLPREGRYGKFYYCGNRCDGQKAVSDKYWQSVRK